MKDIGPWIFLFMFYFLDGYMVPSHGTKIGRVPIEFVLCKNVLIRRPYHSL
jgi:hypothetical protein